MPGGIDIEPLSQEFQKHMIYEQVDFMQRNMSNSMMNIEEKLQRFYEDGAEKKFGLDNFDDDDKLSQLSGKSGASVTSAKLSSLG